MKPTNTSNILTRCMVFLVLIILSACEDFVTVEAPPTQILSNNVFQTDNTANTAVAGMYSIMYNNNQTFGGLYLTIISGLSSDEITASGNSTFSDFQTNKLTAENGDVAKIWQNSYAIIYNANAIIEGLQAATGVSAAMKKQFTGEALFIRAFSHG